MDVKTTFSNADHAGCLDTRKSTSGGIQFLGDKLVSWMLKKQNCTAMSSAEAEYVDEDTTLRFLDEDTTEAEYVALSASCAQLRMTKVIKGEFEKLEDLKVKDVSLNVMKPSLEVFNNEFNRLTRMEDDLFTYKVEVANILCDSNKDDDSEQRMSHETND
ncbi:uncharacterized mitochondrial protein-like protein [Tanacetum coccineum]